MSWIIFDFWPLSKQWGGQPGLPSLPGSPAAAVSSRMRVNCDSSPWITTPNYKKRVSDTERGGLVVLYFVSDMRMPLSSSPGNRQQDNTCCSGCLWILWARARATDDAKKGKMKLCGMVKINGGSCSWEIPWGDYNVICPIPFRLTSREIELEDSGK